MAHMTRIHALRAIIAELLNKLFGIDPKRVELDDALVDDWGLDARERRRFDEEFYKLFPGRQSPVPFVTVRDYAKFVL